MKTNEIMDLFNQSLKSSYISEPESGYMKILDVQLLKENFRNALKHTEILDEINNKDDNLISKLKEKGLIQ